jgi:hypothetical protein
MTFAFRQITGSEDSKPENFSSLCSRLLMKVFPGAKPVDGKGGDEGLDTFIGVFNGVCRVFQHKYFIERVGPSQRRQIERSIQKAIASHEVTSWTLMLPIELTPSEIKWFQRLQLKNPSVEMDWWGRTKLQELLANHPDVAGDFKLQSSIVIKLEDKNIDIENSSIETITKALSELVSSVENATLPRDVILAAVEDLRSRVRLKILVLGPSDPGDIYAKRCQIRQLIRNQGHEVDFFEEILTPGVREASGLNLGVEEIIRALGYDYIVCLMTSAGTISEFQLFAPIRELANRMLTCVDERHKGGFIAQSLIPVYEGHNGRVDWFKDPTDIKECHLATRVLVQINNVAQMKQFVLATGSTRL